jgi:hypothetical protein
MTQSTVHEQIGHFIVMFQHAEAELTELLVLMAHADDEFIRILTNDLEYSKRVNTTDVMFARFIDLRPRTDETEKSEFHKLEHRELQNAPHERVILSLTLGVSRII